MKSELFIMSHLKKNLCYHFEMVMISGTDLIFLRIMFRETIPESPCNIQHSIPAASFEFS